MTFSADTLDAGPAGASHDVVVVGSGGAGLLTAGMAAASGASVLVLEAGQTVGGTTAMSGGMLWIPCNTPALRAGLADSPEAAELYLSQMCTGAGVDNRIRTYVQTAPEMLDHLLEHTAVRVTADPDFPDYRQLAGSRSGRSVDQEPFALSDLGAAAELIDTAGHVPLTLREAHALKADRSKARRIVAERREARSVTGGPALIAALLKFVLDAGARVRTNARVADIDRRVTGVYEVTLETGESVSARHGLVLASGGFEWDVDLVRDHLDVTLFPLSVPTNRGDVLRMAPRLGAAVAEVGDAWWAPVYLTGTSDPATRDNAFFAARPMALPGSLVVDAHGRRFTNEAMNYYDQGPLLRGRLGDHGPAGWLVFDSRFKETYPLPGTSQDPPALLSATSLEELAAAAGLPPDETARTIAVFNTDAGMGIDTQYSRGGFAYDHYHGDLRNEPNPNLAALERPPFYAVPVGLGVLGTNSGLATDLDGRVLDTSGRPIEGLYAVGNVAGSMLGHVYPGAGGTLGPGLTAAYRAARHLEASAGR